MKSVIMSEQLGGDDFDSVHELGAATVRDVLRKFDEKNWATETAAAAATEMCAPTLALRQPDSDHLFWVSSYLSGGELRYVSEFSYPLESPGFFSRLLRKTHSSPRTRELSSAEARKGLELFATESYPDLLELIRDA